MHQSNWNVDGEMIEETEAIVLEDEQQFIWDFDICMTVLPLAGMLISTMLGPFVVVCKSITICVWLLFDSETFIIVREVNTLMWLWYMFSI